MNLPEGAKLTYIVSAEAWYKQGTDRPELWVSYADEQAGRYWSFTVERHDLSGECARVCVFDDGFAAFEDIPEFFSALAAERAGSLDDVRRLLARIGAADVTDRHRPGDKSATGRLRSDFERVLSESRGRELSEVARDLLAVLRLSQPESDEG